MQCKFQVLPRQYGKTTKLIEMFKDSYDDRKESVVLIAPRAVHVYKIQKELRVGPNFQNICSVSSFINKQTEKGIKPLVYDKVLIDEYFLMTEEEQAQLYNLLRNTPSTVHIMTSAVKLINQDILSLIRNVKRCGPLVEYIVFTDKAHNRQAEYLMSNFISDPMTEIIVPYHDRKNIMTPDQYELSLGKLYDL